MKLAIISDSHDNLINLERFLAWVNSNGIGMIIHCGDLAAPAVITKELGPKFQGLVYLVYGNVADRPGLKKAAEKFNQVFLSGDQGELVIPADSAGGRKLKIAFCHFPDQAKQLAAQGDYQLVFYGHSHRPWIEKIGDCQLVNPGTLGGLFQKATFAVFDSKTKNLELKILAELKF